MGKEVLTGGREGYHYGFVVDKLGVLNRRPFW